MFTVLLPLAGSEKLRSRMLELYVQLDATPLWSVIVAATPPKMGLNATVGGSRGFLSSGTSTGLAATGQGVPTGTGAEPSHVVGTGGGSTFWAVRRTRW